MVLVWGVRHEGTEAQKKRAKWLFEQFEQERPEVIIPSVALSEYLTPVQTGKRSEVIAELSSRFVIAPFDVRCAALAARLFSEGKEARLMEVPNARKTLRSDALIIASAFVHGAQDFYSGDAACRNLASKVESLNVHDLPEVPATLMGYLEE